MKAQDGIHVHVLVTRSGKFRAVIEENKQRHGVNLLGKNWSEGLYRRYEPQVIECIRRIMKNLFRQYTTIMADRRTIPLRGKP